MIADCLKRAPNFLSQKQQPITYLISSHFLYQKYFQKVLLIKYGRQRARDHILQRQQQQQQGDNDKRKKHYAINFFFCCIFFEMCNVMLEHRMKLVFLVMELIIIIVAHHTILMSPLIQFKFEMCGAFHLQVTETRGRIVEQFQKAKADNCIAK